MRVQSILVMLCIAVVPLLAQYGLTLTVVEDTIQSGATPPIEWHFVLTNTGSVPDTFAFDLRVYEADTAWFIQHCAGGLCAEPGVILTVALDAGQSDSEIDVQVFFDSGPDTAFLNHHVQSLGNPSLMDSINLYAISEMSVAEQNDFAVENAALSVYPNPFSKLAQIRCEIQDAGYGIQDFSLHIYDVTGRVVKSFDAMPYAPGSLHFSWDGTDMNGVAVPQGVYIVRIEGPSIVEQRQIIRLQ